MDADEERAKLNEITEKVISAAYEVGNELGSGFLEKVYENAMCAELTERGVSFRQQAPIDVNFKGRNVGEYFADIRVEESFIVELNVATDLDWVHMVECWNYLNV